MRAIGLVVVSTLTALTLSAVALVVAGNTLPKEIVEGVNEAPYAERFAQTSPIVLATGASLVALRVAWSALGDDGPSAAWRKRQVLAWLTAATTLAALWFTVVVLLLGR